MLQEDGNWNRNKYIHMKPVWEDGFQTHAFKGKIFLFPLFVSNFYIWSAELGT